MDKLKLEILMIDSSVGNEYSVCLSEGLKNAGANISLVTTRDREFYKSPIYSLKLWAPSKSQEASKIRKIFTYLSYQWNIIYYTIMHRNAVIHFQFFRRKFDSIIFSLLGFLTNRIYLTAHNVLPHENKQIDYFLNKLVYKAAAGLVVHTDFIKKKLLKNFNVDPKKVHVIPHGNFDFFVDSNTNIGTHARKNFNLNEDDNVLLFFGNIREYKGLDILLDSFDDAAEKDHKLKLLIAGNPFNNDLKEFYENRIAQLKFKGRVTYHFMFIPIKDVKKYFEACDLVTLPYHKIDHSGIVHLAYSFGKPILATPVGDFVEVIENGESGFLTENNEPANLTKWISTAFSDKDKLIRMGRYASELNGTKYSWDNIAIKTLKMYAGENEGN